MAFWFGVNPFELTTQQQNALMLQLPRVQAQDQIRRGGYDPLNPDEVYRVYLQAYGDEEAAADMMKRSAELRVESKVNQR